MNANPEEPTMKRNCTYRLGDLLYALYEEFKAVYRGDRELARMAALATLNDLLLTSQNQDNKKRRQELRRVLTAA